MKKVVNVLDILLNEFSVEDFNNLLHYRNICFVASCEEELLRGYNLSNVQIYTIDGLLSIIGHELIKRKELTSSNGLVSELDLLRRSRVHLLAEIPFIETKLDLVYILDKLFIDPSYIEKVHDIVSHPESIVDESIKYVIRRILNTRVKNDQDEYLRLWIDLFNTYNKLIDELN